MDDASAFRSGAQGRGPLRRRRRDRFGASLIVLTSAACQAKEGRRRLFGCFSILETYAFASWSESAYLCAVALTALGHPAFVGQLVKFYADPGTNVSLAVAGTNCTLLFS